jgi:hypothetical protein
MLWQVLGGMGVVGGPLLVGTGPINRAQCCSIIDIKTSLACTSPPLRLARGRKGIMAWLGGEHLPRPKLDLRDVCFTL